MDPEALRDYCLLKTGTEESFPFDEHTLVFKVGGKMYALINLKREPLCVNLKCNPERATALREAYAGAIIPGYHMNKKHWNTVLLDGMQNSHLQDLIDHSYELVIANLPKRRRDELLENRSSNLT